MKKSKKAILGVLLAGIVLVGNIGGVVLANDDNDDSSGDRHSALLERVCEVYEEITGNAIDPDSLSEAFQTAREEMLPEDMPERHGLNGQARPDCLSIDAEAMLERLDTLLEDETITQEQYDEMVAWLEDMPEDTESDEYQEWLEDRPDVDIMFGMGEHGSRKDMRFEIKLRLPDIDAEAMLEKLGEMLDNGIIDQEQYDELAAWLEDMPESTDSEEFQEWLEARPDLPIPFGIGEHGMRESFGGLRGTGEGFSGMSLSGPGQLVR